MVDDTEEGVIKIEAIAVEFLLTTCDEFNLAGIDGEITRHKRDIVIDFIEAIRSIGGIVNAAARDNDVVIVCCNIGISAGSNPSGAKEIDGINLLPVRKSSVSPVRQAIVKNGESGRAKG